MQWDRRWKMRSEQLLPPGQFRRCGVFWFPNVMKVSRGTMHENLSRNRFADKRQTRSPIATAPAIGGTRNSISPHDYGTGLQFQRQRYCGRVSGGPARGSRKGRPGQPQQWTGNRFRIRALSGSRHLRQSVWIRSEALYRLGHPRKTRPAVSYPRNSRTRAAIARR